MNKNYNILIVGSTGMLGGTIKSYLTTTKHKVHSFNRNELDLSVCSFSDLENKIKNQIKENNIDIIINCAGIIKQRKSNVQDMIHVNSIIPHWISNISKNNNLKLIHFTTDCVFDGSKGMYSENDIHSDNDIYGVSKSLGEPVDCTVIRTSIIGEENRNKLSLLEWVKSNKDSEINGYKNHLWNGVTCLQLSKIVLNIIENDNSWIGTRHIFSNQVNKYDLLKMINEIYKLNIKINPINDKVSIDRTLDTVYDIDEFNIPNLYKQIEETKEFHDTIRGNDLKKYYDNLI